MGERRMQVLVGAGSVREIFAIEARRLYGCADLIIEIIIYLLSNVKTKVEVPTALALAILLVCEVLLQLLYPIISIVTQSRVGDCISYIASSSKSID